MENQKNREADLAALNELKNDYIQIYSLEKEIKTEEKRIEELKENMNRHGLKPPKSEANKVRLAAYRPKCKKVDTISNIFFCSIFDCWISYDGTVSGRSFFCEWRVSS